MIPCLDNEWGRERLQSVHLSKRNQLNHIVKNLAFVSYKNCRASSFPLQFGTYSESDPLRLYLPFGE